MTTKTPKKEYILDASGKKLGRIATEAADLLRGKNIASFERNKLPEVVVVINNASKVDLSERKLGRVYTRHSEHPGGFKAETREHLINRLGYKEVFRKAIRGMIPNNRLRTPALKNLIINE